MVSAFTQRPHSFFGFDSQMPFLSILRVVTVTKQIVALLRKQTIASCKISLSQFSELELFWHPYHFAQRLIMPIPTEEERLRRNEEGMKDLHLFRLCERAED